MSRIGKVKIRNNEHGGATIRWNGLPKDSTLAVNVTVDRRGAENQAVIRIQMRRAG